MEGTLQAEMEALVGSGTIRRVKVEQLTDEPGYDRMEVAPSKIVPTIKSPSGKRKARIVICGNMVHLAGHVKPSQLYLTVGTMVVIGLVGLRHRVVDRLPLQICMREE